MTSFSYLKSSSSFAIALEIAPYMASKVLHGLASGNLSSITNHLASPCHLVLVLSIPIPKAPQGDLCHRALALAVFLLPRTLSYKNYLWPPYYPVILRCFISFTSHITLNCLIYWYVYCLFPCRVSLVSHGFSGRGHTLIVVRLSSKFHILRTEMSTQRQNFQWRIPRKISPELNSSVLAAFLVSYT